MVRGRLVAILLLTALPTGCAEDRAREEPLMVFAAASLREVAVDLGTEFERRQGRRVTFNFGGSNVLAQQIRATSARADVFLSADRHWIDELERTGHAVAGSRRAFLGNRLVAIRHRDSGLRPGGPRELAESPFRRLALADPAAVPAGRYARAYLEGAGEGLWPAVADRVVPALDVRAAVTLVASDPDNFGIVYRTDVAASDRVSVLFEFAPRADLPIVYWAVAIRGGSDPAGAAALLDFLGRPAAAEIAQRHGFSAASG